MTHIAKYVTDNSHYFGVRYSRIVKSAHVLYLCVLSEVI